MVSSFPPKNNSGSQSMLSPGTLMPQGQDPFLLAQPQLREAQVYVTAGTLLIGALQGLENQSRLAGTFSQFQVFFDLLIKICQPFCQHCVTYETVVVQESQTLTTDIVQYGQQASTVYSNLKQTLNDWRIGKLSDTAAQATLNTQIKLLQDMVRAFANNATAICQEIANFIQQISQDQQQFQPALSHGRQMLEQEVPLWSPARPRILQTLDIASGILPELLSTLKASSPTLEKLEGVWSTISSDLTNLVQVINQDIQQVPLIITDEGITEAIADWKKIVQLASNCIQTPMNINKSANAIIISLTTTLQPGVVQPIPAHW
jgi:hypothetical protein